MKDHGNAQPTLLDEELLNGVRERCLTARVFPTAGVAWPTDLSEAVAVSECASGFVRIEIAVGIDQCVGLLLPHAHHLRRFFLERHAREEVLDATLGGKVGGLIGQHAGCWYWLLVLVAGCHYQHPVTSNQQPFNIPGSAGTSDRRSRRRFAIAGWGEVREMSLRSARRVDCTSPRERRRTARRDGPCRTSGRAHPRARARALP